MTYWAKLFLVLIALKNLLANPIPTETPFVPIIDSEDLNNNGIKDFFAFDNADYPRKILHIEFVDNHVEILSQYEMEKDGYFTDIIFGDFDNNQQKEIIATSYQDESENVFYIFEFYEFEIPSPLIINLQGLDSQLNKPKGLYKLSPDTNNNTYFLTSQGSPNRLLVLCEYSNKTIIYKGLYGLDFLKNTTGPIEVVLGHFDEDKIEDIFILNNSFNPTGLFVFSNAVEKEIKIQSDSNLLFIHQNGIDLDLDMKDDLLMLDKKGRLLSNIWISGNESNTIQLSNEDKAIIFTKLNSDSAILDLITFNNNGDILQSSIDLAMEKLIDQKVLLGTNKNDLNGIIIGEEIIFSSNNGETELILINELNSDLLLSDTDNDIINFTENKEKNEELIFSSITNNNTNIINDTIGIADQYILLELKSKIKESKNKDGNLVLSGEIINLGNQEADSVGIIIKARPNFDDNSKYKIYQSDIVAKGSLDELLIDNVSQLNKSDNSKLLPGEIGVFSITMLDNEFVDIEHEIFYKKPILLNDAELDMVQHISQIKPDTFIQVNNLFVDQIFFEENFILSEFLADTLPNGMNFNIENYKLEWTPSIKQLGTHKIDYEVILQNKGNLYINTNEGIKVETENDTIKSNVNSYLVYVNDPVKFNEKKIHTSTESNKTFEIEIDLEDKNINSNLNAKIISGPNDAEIQIFSSDTLIFPKKEAIIPDSVIEVETAENILFEENTPTEKKLELSTEEILEIVNENIRELSPEETNILEETHVNETIDGQRQWIRKKDDTKVEIIEQKVDKTNKSNNLENKIAPIELEESVLNDTPLEFVTYKNIPQYKLRLEWVPRELFGEEKFSIHVSDDYTSDTLDLFIKINPKIDLNSNKTNHIIAKGEPFIHTIEINQNPSSPKYYYKLENAPHNMRIYEQGVINWIPLDNQINDNIFNIHVNDGISTANIEFNIYVNSPPVISARPPQNYIISSSDSVFFRLEYFDSNSEQKIKWHLTEAPSGMKIVNIDNESNLIWDNTKLGHHPYTLEVTDGIDNNQWRGSIYINSPPVFQSTPKKLITEFEPYEYPLFATDSNVTSPYSINTLNHISYKLEKGPDAMFLDEKNIVRWKSEQKIPGEYFVSVSANDEVAKTIQSFTLLVNSFPRIINIDTTSVEVGNKIEFLFQAHDSNPEDVLSFYIEGKKGGMKIDNKTGEFTWTPQEKDLGLHSLAVSVKDNFGTMSDAQNFKIFVYKRPQFITTLPLELFSGLEFSAMLEGIDMNGLKLKGMKAIQVESTTIKPGHYTFSEQSFFFRWVPRVVDKGKHNIVIKLTDDYGLETSYTHNFEVFVNPCVNYDCTKQNINLTPNDIQSK